MTYKLPEPDLYAHELITNEGGVWLGVPEKGICEQAYAEGETGREVRRYYMAATTQQIADAAYAEGLAARVLEVYCVSSKVFNMLFATEAQADLFISRTTPVIGATKMRLDVLQPETKP